MKLIDLYKEWMETGEIKNRHKSNGDGGLCNAVPKKYVVYVNLFEPEDYHTYWASEAKEYSASHKACYGFNKTRQMIVLFICAMCDEL